MQKLIACFIALSIWSMSATPAFAAGVIPGSDTHLVPCQASAAFQERMNNAPDNYYFDQPYQAYAAHLLCGEDGLPHLQLRLDRALDVVIPFGLFFYVAGFIGWSGRAYLMSANKLAKSGELEIFIDLSLAIRSFAQGLFWPLIVFKELTSGELTAPQTEISVSPR